MENKDLHSKKIKHVGFTIRFIAHLIDFTLIVLTTLSLITLLKAFFNFDLVEISEIIAFIIGLFYYVNLTSSIMQATIGKYLLGVIVVDKQMQKLSRSHALARYLAYYFSYLTLGIGFIMIVLTKKRIALHDLIADSYVIYNEKIN